MDYFADTVFSLTDEQKELAADYAANLHLFLFDTVYKVDINEYLPPGKPVPMLWTLRLLS